MKNDFQRSLPVTGYGLRGMIAILIDISHEIVQQSSSERTYTISCCAVLREKVIPSFCDNILFGQFCRIHLYTTIVRVNNTIFFRERFFFTAKSVYDQNTRTPV